MDEERIVNKNTIVLFMAIFLVGVGFSIIIPVLPYLAESMGANAFQLGLLLTVYALCQFLFSPLWGSYSDVAGRKPVLLVGVFGFALTFVLMGLSTRLWMLFAARIAGGIFSCATMPTAMAFIADSSSLEKRGASMGLIGAAMGMGMIFGPALGGILSNYSLAMPFYAAGTLSILNGLALLFLVKESLPREKRSPAVKLHRAPLLEGLKTPLAVLFIVMLLGSMGESTHHGVFALFSEAKVGFGARDIGWTFTTAGIVSVLVQGMAVGRLIAWWGEERTARLGLLLMVVSFILFLNFTTLLQAILAMAVFAAGVGMVRPSISAAVSRRTTQNQGKAMGILQGYDSLGRVIGPSLGGFLLDRYLSYAYLAGIAAAISGLLILLVMTPEKNCVRDEASQEGRKYGGK